MMTQWGSILIYFELPEWVADTGASLVEEDYDSNSVKALKVGIFPWGDPCSCSCLVPFVIHYTHTVSTPLVSVS
jgi:hypothetical protein